MGLLDLKLPQRIHGALALVETVATTQQKIVLLPCLLRDLTEVERYVLARAAVHTWTHQGRIPYLPPTNHQKAVANYLASPGVKLLEAIVTLDCRQAYRLSHQGAVVAQQVLHVIPLEQLAAREREFSRMCRLMRNDWETRD